MYPDRVHHAVHHSEVEKWGKMGENGGKWGNMGKEKWGEEKWGRKNGVSLYFPSLSPISPHFPPISPPFPPISPISPHFPPFSPISPHFSSFPIFPAVRHRVHHQKFCRVHLCLAPKSGCLPADSVPPPPPVAKQSPAPIPFVSSFPHSISSTLCQSLTSLTLPSVLLQHTR